MWKLYKLSGLFRATIVISLFNVVCIHSGHSTRHVAAGVIGGIFAVGAAVVALPLVGFGAAGITAGSYAASMMSAAAVANGGGVVAGGVVATLQAIGAAGLGATGGAVVAGTGAAVGAAASGVAGAVEDTSQERKKDKKN